MQHRLLASRPSKHERCKKENKKITVYPERSEDIDVGKNDNDENIEYETRLVDQIERNRYDEQGGDNKLDEAERQIVKQEKHARYQGQDV